MKLKPIVGTVSDRFSDSSLWAMQLLRTPLMPMSYRLLKISRNRRLEFLGDAVLIRLFRIFCIKNTQNRPEEICRSMIVREESLAGFSQDCQFDRYIKLG